MLRALPGDVDSVLVSHHPHRVGVQRLGVAACAVRLDPSTGARPGQSFGHLGAGAVARAQEQHPCDRRSRREGAGWRRDEVQPGVQRGAGGDEERADAVEVDEVVGVAAVGRASSRRDQAAVPQLAEVVGDEALGLTHESGQLVHRPVAAAQLTEQSPAQRMTGELQER